MSFGLVQISVLELFARLAIAAVLGALMGLERERQSKPAGLRTHIMVTLGAASFALIGTEMLAELGPDQSGARMDPSRVVEGIIGGIGFIGAGSIIRSRGSIEGLTTAASVWVAGGIGAACGVGMYAIAIVTSGFALFTLWVLGTVEHRLIRKPAPRDPEPPAGPTRRSDPEAAE